MTPDTIVQLASANLETIARGLLAAVAATATAPFTPRREVPLTGVKRFLAAAIVAIGAAIWAIESEPSWLMTFVVSGGLGFSGYSLIELAGREVLAAFKGALGAITSVFRRTGRA